MTNSRFEALEARCQKLRLKRYLKIFLFIAVVMSLGWMSFSSKHLFSLFENNASIVATEIKYLDTNHTDFNTILKEENSSLEQNETNTSSLNQETLKLSLTINRERYPASAKEKSTDNPNKVTETISKNSPPLQIQRDFDLSAPEQAPKTFSMSVKSLNSEEALLKSHTSTPTFKTTYELAAFYFEKNDYPKAIKWSKEANKLDPASDKPWIIYAQSKYALMEREDAIKALEVFLQYVHSQEAQALLEKYRGQK